MRGLYDLTGMRADADLMLWLHGDRPEDLQAELRRLRRTAELGGLLPSWSAMGVHRPAEFSADHQPAFMSDRDPLEWLCLYPFVRSYDWYLLPEEERRLRLLERDVGEPLELRVHDAAGRRLGEKVRNQVAARHDEPRRADGLQKVTTCRRHK